MKKGLVTLIIIAAILIGGFLWVKGAYNNMVTEDENVQNAWAQVEPTHLPS